MKPTILTIILTLSAVMIHSCSNGQQQPGNTSSEKDSAYNKYDSLFSYINGENEYSNELFSILYPDDWMVDDSNWQGSGSSNEIFMYPQSGDHKTWIHCFKLSPPVQLKNIDEVTYFVDYAREALNDNFKLLEITKDAEIGTEGGGYPAATFLFANFEDADSIIEKEIITYLPKSNILLYFSINATYSRWTEFEPLGNAIVATAEIKNVEDLSEAKDQLMSLNSEQ